MRIITKELALRIIDKLKAKKVRSGKAHDDYAFEYNGRIILQTSLRRGSEKDIGHDHMPGDLGMGPGKTKLFAQCNVTMKQYIKILKGQGLIEAEEGDEEESEE